MKIYFLCYFNLKKYQIMKKQSQDKKKLSLNNVRLMKLNDMKTINGGNGLQQGFYEDQEPTPPIKDMPSAKCNG